MTAFTPHDERVPAGWCQHCRRECGDRLGAEVFPHMPDLAERVFWCCPTPGCGARVGSHGSKAAKALQGKPLGTAANAQLRDARVKLHGRLDPIWKDAWNEPEYASARAHPMESDERRKAFAIIQRTARKRVYSFLADRMGLPYDQTHVAMFSLEECRDAWRALRDVTYADVRVWAKSQPRPEKPPAPSAEPPSA